MINKTIIINKTDMLLKIGNKLNKVAESMANEQNRNLVSQMQPDGLAQDNRLLDDAFKVAMKKLVRSMAPYVKDTAYDDLQIDPQVLQLSNELGASGTLHISTKSNWNIVINEVDENSDDIYAVLLQFPDSWLDNNIIQDQAEELFTTQMMASYLEDVDKQLAEWYRKEVEDKAHDLSTMCASRKPGTRFYVTSPFGENPYRRY